MLLRGHICAFIIICALLAISYCVLAFAQDPVVVLAVRFFQATLLLMDSLTLTQVIQGAQPQAKKRSASNQTEIVLNLTAAAVQLALFFLQKYDIPI